MPRAAAICVSHGGGPMPVLGDKTHKDIVHSLSKRVPKILKLGTPESPRAIVVVTAHWSEQHPTISSGKRHALYYDYGGFPREAYQLQYDAPGSPDVANELKQALEKEGFKPVMNEKRGWDHGVFIPMLLINPAADIPVVQLSVLSSEDPLEHIAMGQALNTLRDSNVAVVGSGFASMHNMSKFRMIMMGAPDVSGFRSAMQNWNASVTEAVSEHNLEDRGRRLEKWRDFPKSYDMHPLGGAEHFMPLLVLAGAAGDQARCETYVDDFAGMPIWTYYWSDVKA